MKIEDIERACELNKELKEIEEILKLQPDKDELLSSVLLLFHDNKKYNIYSFLTLESETKIMNIIFDDCKERAKQIEQEIEEL
jgi:hypothetical protein